MRAHLYHISQVVIRVAACERAKVLLETQICVVLDDGSHAPASIIR